jgi:DNA-binding PadR family transcriptional regulator
MFYDILRSRLLMSSHHHGRHGHRGGGGAPWGGADFPGARKLASGDLQLVILALLAERPAHGYELIRRLEDHSGGFYVPSPGMIYPALTYLDEVGYASSEADGARKLYRVTEAGLAHLAANRVQADAILAGLARIGGRMDQVREAFSGSGDADNPAFAALDRARHALKSALARCRGGNAEEMLRIAAILDRAAAEILGAQAPASASKDPS